MENVINPLLYDRLRSAYGKVQVTNRGLEFDYDVQIDPLTKQWRIEKHGGCENYRVDCPFCGDNRRRLYFNHMYGHELKDGRLGAFLLNCFHRGCTRDMQNRDTVWEQLKTGGRPLSGARLQRSVVVEKPTHCVLPGSCPRLTDLPYYHKANNYLISRGYDTDKLTRLYDVRYCTQCLDTRLQGAVGRIIIPIYRKGLLVGWQGRYVGDIAWKREDVPKYYNWPHMDKSSWVPELEDARNYHTGVLVEGYPGRWRLGRFAMPLLGHTLNDRQLRMLQIGFRKGALIYLLDPDVWSEPVHRQTVRKLKDMLPGRFAAIRLPESFDPGDLDRNLLLAFLKHEAGRKGVKVRWQRRAISGYGGSACVTA